MRPAGCPLIPVTRFSVESLEPYFIAGVLDSFMVM